MDSAWVTVAFPEGCTPAGRSLLLRAVVSAEVAQDTAKGLMDRAPLPEGQGMFFDMGATAVHPFYMRRVGFSLDMIFISSDLVIVGIVQNARPFDETLRSVAAPSRYVLEVRGGWVARHCVEVGQRVEVSNG